MTLLHYRRFSGVCWPYSNDQHQHGEREGEQQHFGRMFSSLPPVKMFTRHYFRRAFTGFGVALVRRQLSPHRAMPQNTGWLRYPWKRP
jgi:hypothetical protein